MEPNQSLFKVLKNDTEKAKIIVENVLVMLSNRVYFTKKGEKRPLLILPEARSRLEDRGDYTYTIQANNGTNYAFKIIFQRVTTTGKQSVISEFFNDYTQYKRIVIAQDYNNNKIEPFVAQRHAQAFRESSLLANIIDYHDQPRFEILSPIEAEKYKQDYNTNEYTTKKFVKSDPIVRYYDLRKGQIVRIIRSSPTTGLSVDYRIVS